jgi:8-oxo-dGTP pyrophosphatase MutT (NUDIX family)
VVWGKGSGTPLPLRISGYVSAEAPPLAYVTSVRALVFRGDALLALPQMEATLRREVLEESGWTLGARSPLGFMHYHNRGPRAS